MDELNTLLKKNLGLHMIVENEVRLTPFGLITFNVELKDGVAKLETINIAKQRRYKYTIDKKDEQ